MKFSIKTVSNRRPKRASVKRIAAKSQRLVSADMRRLAQSRPTKGAAAMVLSAGGQRPAIVARVQAKGQRVVAELIDARPALRQIGFTKTKDGGYCLAGSRNPRGIRLYVP